MTFAGVYKKYKSFRPNGFTLPELIVTISIMIVITSIMLFNYNRFNDSTIINTLAYDMSLTIRQAQVYGISVRELPVYATSTVNVNSPNHGNFVYAYGVHFDAATQTNFKLFIDLNGNKLRDSASEDLQDYTIRNNDKIMKICMFRYYSNAIDEKCSDDAANNISYIDITFKRPNPDAQVISSNSSLNNTYPGARIYVTNSDQTIKKVIVIEATGQISVQTPLSDGSLGAVEGPNGQVVSQKYGAQGGILNTGQIVNSAVETANNTTND